MNHTADAIAPPDLELLQVGDVVGQRAQRRGLLQGSVWPVGVVEVLNEVRHAHDTRTDLYVVDRIRWDVRADGTISTSGGRQRRWPDWRPAEASLTPTRFRYQIPAG